MCRSICSGTDLLPMVIREGINPEIGFSHRDLDRFAEADFREIAERLADAGLSVTFHAPFLDLRPGAIEPKIRQVTARPAPPGFRTHPLVSAPLRRLPCLIRREILHFLPRSCGSKTVSKPGGASSGMSRVRGRSSPWRTSMSGAPSPICPLSRRPRLARMSGSASTPGTQTPSGAHRTKSGWRRSASRLGEIHIHDNHGATDEHLPVGEGTFPFPEFMEGVRERNLAPILTVESHSEESLVRMVKNIRTMKLLEFSLTSLFFFID